LGHVRQKQLARRKSEPATPITKSRSVIASLGIAPDAAEERIIEEMRHLGREAMQGWAERQVEVTEREIRQQPQMHRQGKKNSAGIRNSAISRS
jgi:hypothetical protein